jgi:hypothetical protein
MPENEKAETKKSGKEKAIKNLEPKKTRREKPKDRNQNQPRHIPQTKAI